MVIEALKHTASATPTLDAIKKTIEQDFTGGRPVPQKDFADRIKSTISHGTLKSIDTWRDHDLTIRVRQPSTVLFTQTELDALALERLAEHATAIYTTAGSMNITFNIGITLEGEKPDAETLTQLNNLLGQIKTGWKVNTTNR